MLSFRNWKNAEQFQIFHAVLEVCQTSYSTCKSQNWKLWIFQTLEFVAFSGICYLLRDGRRGYKEVKLIHTLLLSMFIWKQQQVLISWCVVSCMLSHILTIKIYHHSLITFLGMSIGWTLSLSLCFCVLNHGWRVQSVGLRPNNRTSLGS